MNSKVATKQYEPYTAKDLETDQEVRWCPSCGDFAILKQVQLTLPKLGIPRENIVFVSGIGCSSRFPYYMNTYGIHSIHGRAPAIATGLKITRPELSVWIITGDGDGLSIGGNHLIHLFRRNPDVNVLLFNNQIYGLTKGQYSPTSEMYKVTKSSPYGTVDKPFNPLSLALGADASFVARSMDKEARHLQRMLERCFYHRGTSFLEIYQNCNVFNDNAFEVFSNKSSQKRSAIFLEHGKPLAFGENESLGIVLDGYQPKIVSLQDGYSLNDLWIHDEKDLLKAQILVRFFEEDSFPRPFGVIYAKERLTLEEEIYRQLQDIKNKSDNINLGVLLAGSHSWTVS
ncbi:MAG: 2-oxoacid:ferredoxin oxidoreductase subunit beta [Chitinophagales bacterium]|nr:2-oxoacid:ferredoxin oxidoreductase subunit beta [Chitinophagales bacterium]MDW8273820.1 2-oxoacid:ferredoxin oxidoreductase subunit beta [Chitinophagales bacterium]